MTNKTKAILKMIENMGKVKIDLDNGEIEITAVFETTAPLKVLIENSVSNWITAERECIDEPEGYFKRLRRYAMEEIQEYKELLTALKGLTASFSEYEAIFTLEPGIELIIAR